jgi:hypothetical protein
VQAERGSRLANRWHEPVDLNAGLTRRLVPLLDGTLRYEELLAVTRAAPDAFDEAMRRIASLRLFIA